VTMYVVDPAASAAAAGWHGDAAGTASAAVLPWGAASPVPNGGVAAAPGASR
jgi:hypothetical protein